MENKKLTCISCPEGCILDAVIDDCRISSISGNKCKKGLVFAETEIFNPTRILTTTIRIDSEDYSRLPVRSSVAVPKNDIFTIISELKKIKVKAPIKMGDIVLKKSSSAKTAIIASMSIEK
ncbi:MAG: DUF1667 domain-containing protein [Actinomycetota bacterium]|jgi:CxxC motif-containing protein|nr:DUF1667 domain-containing protein [Actinomycetota bacterium]